VQPRPTEAALTMAVIFFSIIVLWVFSLCLHEYGHARVAYEGGDTSVAEKGYLSFNPARYMHPALSIYIPLLILAIGGIPLPGGAVYIDHSRLRGPRWESAVSAAGPASNLALAVLSGLPFALGLHGGAGPNDVLWVILAFFCFLQTFATVINLLPVPGLDGWGIIEPWMSHDVRSRARDFTNVSILVLLVVLITDNPVRSAILDVIYWLPARLSVPQELMFQGYAQFQAFLGFNL